MDYRDTHFDEDEPPEGPPSYEDYWRSHGGTPILLPHGRAGGEAVFWSKGWQGCHFGCKKRVDDHTMTLTFRRVEHNGVIRQGWYCRRIT